jgi:hypothetical protein
MHHLGMLIPMLGRIINKYKLLETLGELISGIVVSLAEIMEEKIS